MQRPPFDLAKIHMLDFPENQYYKDAHDKRQIYLHHTASGKGVTGDYKHWLNDPKKIATCMIIDYDGTPNQCFNSSSWGHHLGVEVPTFREHKLPANSNVALNQRSIAIEIDAWGTLALHEGKYYSWAGSVVPAEEVEAYSVPFKKIPSEKFFVTIGQAGKPAMFYHRYSRAQIETTAQLLVFWADKYKIPKTYQEDMWDVTVRALRGDPGIWTHVSVRPDKSDCHPQPELIEMLKSIS